MARKNLKKANKAYITDITKTQYDGFVDDVNDFLHDVKELNLVDRLGTAQQRVITIRDEIHIPTLEELRQQSPNKREEELQKKIDALTYKKTILDKLIIQMGQIAEFAGEAAAQIDEKRTSLNHALNFMNYDPRKLDPYVQFNETELLYASHMTALRTQMTNASAIFCGGNANGFPKNLKSNLDAYNTITEYSDYNQENSVFLEVDDIFSEVQKLYTKTFTILSKANRHRTEKLIEKEVDYDTQNMLDYGKQCYNNPTFHVNNATNLYLEKLKADNDAKKAVTKAQKELDTLEEEARKITVARNKLLENGPQNQEKRQRAIKEHNRLLEIYNRFKDTKETLQNGTFKMEFPGLEELDKSQAKEYKTLDEVMKANRSALQSLDMAEVTAKKKLAVDNDELKAIIKTTNDNRLTDFYNKELLRYQYTMYPKMGRKVVSLISNLPSIYRLDLSTRTIPQLRKDIEEKRAQNGGHKDTWYNIISLLDYIEMIIPREFVIKPLQLLSFSESENKAETYAKELDESEVHKTIARHTELKDQIYALSTLLNEAASHKKSDKAYWTNEKKTEVSEAKAALKAAEKEIAQIESGKLYSKGASTVKDRVKKNMDLTEDCFNIVVTRVDVYKDLLNIADDELTAYVKGNKTEQRKIFAKIKQIHESLPPEAFIQAKNPQHNKENSNLSRYLKHMEIAQSPEEFKRYYTLYKEELDVYKQVYSDDKLKLAGEKVVEAEEAVKDTDYEKRINEYNTKLDELTTKVSEKRAERSRKGDEQKQANREFLEAMKNMHFAERVYERKEKASNYDPTNEHVAEFKYDIDEKGENFFKNIRNPFDVFYARKDLARTKNHGDSKEFQRMINALSAVLLLRDDVGIDDYKKAIRDVKKYAREYIHERESQWFVNKRNTMRKYRLRYAKDLVALCDDQLENLTEAAMNPAVNPEVKKYLNRTAPVAVVAKTEQQKKTETDAVVQSLEERRDEAIRMYMNSAEYKAIIQSEQDEFHENMDDKAKTIKNTRKTIRNLKKQNVNLDFKNLENMVKNVEKQRDELHKEFIIKEMTRTMNNPLLPKEQKDAAQQKINDIREGRVKIESDPIMEEPDDEPQVIQQADQNMIENPE
ncbi:MAG: hypothetical protein K6A69_07085 [Lachnospiraceae bacterium]|nr:hypothetical protein [Lachnospiraceae bacterium]